MDMRGFATALTSLVAAVPHGRSSAEFLGQLEKIVDARLEVFHSLISEVQRLLDVEGTAVILGGAADTPLRRVAETPVELAVLQETQIRQHRGPDIDCLATGEFVDAIDPDEIRARWPGFGDLAVAAGISALGAIPLRAGDAVIGSMLLARTRPGPLDPVGFEAVAALADVAATAALRTYSLDRCNTLAEQLKVALDSRIRIEQAKGVLAAKLGTSPDEAFAVLRKTARDQNRKLADLAGDVIEGRFDPAADR
ncbi:GAF and ANTAR domain-containing protein [Amycolatopsis alkalitolerans]|nr:GAF and ANTAR domain-containing protein [Amycolatopsis alkalitolerans]